MSMRVTQTMLNNNMMRNYHNSMSKLGNLQEQLSSGKKVSRPSQDPVIATRGMFYRTALVENEQYLRNANMASSWMDMTDNVLNEAGKIMQRVNELLVYSGDGAVSPEDLKAMAEEVSQLKKQLGTLANQTINGRYIFNGTDTTTAPYDPVAGEFIGTNDEEIKLEVNQGVQVPINVNSQNIFNYPDNANNIFKLLDNIVADLSSGQPATQHQAAFTQQHDNLLAERATLGARVNRIELVLERLKDQEVSTTELMSKNEDADEAKVITDLKTQESVHRAALGAGARIIQPSLLDFLR
ncbi:flagellar hook-associated protein FlgL [Brevibacillus humidisoli]|uniref:flagellar hook-associated protein FlgL n=1 Tax=Brevibacillus humidisoli TaxID=2895522 RepID=UPI001E5A63C8|nr:flagellar hook-associated protein FlgL [Brevibacillus humidisoli]UFJ40060.1 flagellar hook-associated protein FlgL [Brevibacillus humidisoli]